MLKAMFKYILVIDLIKVYINKTKEGRKLPRQQKRAGEWCWCRPRSKGPLLGVQTADVILMALIR